MLDSLDVLNTMMTVENNSLKAVVFAVNQKGRSQGVVMSEIVIGGLMKERCMFEKFICLI